MKFLRYAVFLTALLALPGRAEPPRPNILFIFCDDLGYGDVGVFHQNERAAKKDPSIPFFTTPHLDGMAREGIQFRQHYCAAPVCAPSRASLLTGTTQGHATIRDNQFDKELPDTLTLGSVLKQAGYATAAFGKWGLQGGGEKAPKKGKKEQPKDTDNRFPDWPSTPNDRGFDYYLGYIRHRDGHYHYPVEDKKQVWENKTEVSKGMELCYTADLFTAAAKRWITKQRKESPDQPFFAYLAFDTPHAKLQNPPCAYPDGGGLEGGVQWLGKPGQMINTAKGTYDGWMHPDYADAVWDHDKNPETKEEPWPDVQKRYANNVRRIDDCVGDLFTLLSDLGINDNTLVIFSSDNGPSQESYLKESYHPTFFHGFGPFDGIKRDTLEGGLRVPTIAHWPRYTNRGRVAEQPSGHWDWLATFADAAGLPTPAASDGVSLLATLTGQSVQKPGIIYSEYSVSGKTPDYQPFDPSHRGKVRGQMQVVMVDGYKGLRTGIQNADQPFEIYDLKTDPKELHNLAGKPEMAIIQKKMQARALQVRIPNPSAKRPYDEAPVPAFAPLVTEGTAGLSFKCHAGTWPWMPQFEHFETSTIKGNAADLAQVSKIVADAASRQDKFSPPMGMQLQTYVKIPKDGIYRFEITGRGHSMLFVHDIRLIGENPEEGAHKLEGTLPLKAGWHPIRYNYRTTVKPVDFNIRITDEAGAAIALDQQNCRYSLQDKAR